MRRFATSPQEIVRLLIVALVLAISGQLLLGPAPAQSHEWYPAICCSGTDCAPMGDAEDAKEPEPTFTRRGWRLHTGQIVPHQATRPSPDGRFHICRRGGRSDGDLITPAEEPPCLWAPQGAS